MPHVWDDQCLSRRYNLRLASRYARVGVAECCRDQTKRDWKIEGEKWQSFAIEDDGELGEALKRLDKAYHRAVK
jgi:hypothetical protein